MALFKCQCGKDVSDRARNCPHCGVQIALSFKHEPRQRQNNKKGNKSELTSINYKGEKHKQDSQKFQLTRGIIGGIFGCLIGIILSIKWGTIIVLPITTLFFFGAAGYESKSLTIQMVILIPVLILILLVAIIFL